MTPPKARLYKKEYVLELLLIAQSDYDSGQICSNLVKNCDSDSKNVSLICKSYNQSRMKNPKCLAHDRLAIRRRFLSKPDAEVLQELIMEDSSRKQILEIRFQGVYSGT